jgi:hypothetical protein
MAIKRRPLFDPKAFLAKVGEGPSIGKYRAAVDVHRYYAPL